LHTGADDFKSFIEEFDNMLINASNTCDKKWNSKHTLLI
jgi:hypothetical protein